jgi:hypothetical protein
LTRGYNDDQVLKRIVERLTAAPHCIAIEDGLSAVEVRKVEERFGFQFPPDLSALLQYALPIGNVPPKPGVIRNGRGFPNWRDLNSPDLQRQVAWPVDGILHDVQHASFWPGSWSERPRSADESLSFATSELRRAPKLIPIFGHRYICEAPHETGNPVISVWQTDVIYYGANLADYLDIEFFGRSRADERRESSVDIPFWSKLIR